MDTGDTGKLRFALLGPLRAWYGDAELALGRPQQRALLAVLLDASGRTVAHGVLAEGIWGEGAAPADPRKALQLLVHRLRSAFRPHLADSPIVRVGDGYALRAPDAWVDTTEWRRLVAEAHAGAAPARVREVLRAAHRLWAGEPLAGLPGPHAEAVRARLADERLSALEQRLELDAELGDRPDLTAEAAALCLEHPHRPRLVAVHMRALHRAGRTAEALAVYEDARASIPTEALSGPADTNVPGHRSVPTGRPAPGARSGPNSGPGPAGPAPDSPAGLQLRILRGDPTLLGGPADGPAEEDTPVWRAPGQLPAGLADFTGRGDAVDALAEQLGAGGRAVVVSALDGMGGVGKTTLAVHAARRAADRFPDGQLFADLRGADRTPREPAAVLAEFLRALGVAAEDVPPGTAERSACYRSVLTGRRVLVVLDNAAAPEQVEPLLPGSADCAVLVTSRIRLPGLAGAHHLRVDPLPADEAAELFTRIAGPDRVAAEPGLVEEIVAACGRLPLAVRIAASRVAANPGTGLAALAEGLRDERRLAALDDGERAVEATFALSYHRLTPEAARAFRLLSLPEAPDVALPCAAALLDRSEEEADELLEGLVDLNLLHSPGFGRYGYHDLVRAYARDRLAEEECGTERSAAAARLLDFCLATARHADTAARSVDPVERSLLDTPVTLPGRPLATGADAVRWMRDQAPVHAAAVALACTDPALPLAQAAELVDKMGSVLFERTQTTVIAGLAERIAGAAASRGDRAPQALARYVRGTMLWHVNRYEESRTEITRAVALCEALAQDPDPTAGPAARVRAKALLTLAGNARVHGRHAEAAGHAGRAAEVFRGLGAERAQGSALGEFAFNAAHTGRLTEARQAAERGARLMSGTGPVSAATGRYYLARVLRLCGDPEGALVQATGAREEFARLQVTVFEAAAGDLAARIHAECGRATLAAEAAEEALPLARKTSVALEAALLRTLGSALVSLGRPSRARACLQDAAELYARLGIADEEQVVRALLDTLPAP
ncbi:NB-ARC domain-containing protein [Streptomyces sp. NBC_00250]|uniref:AfsR/SARP family transcriptional regulator n=1 Tax=Streptomyces sp. NBC_00250 TaxID=2903641 RepID=UPI002E283E4E|nr:BTAD domain-containing putative transcriptional regulator [Streptomyces sp. NBC_00250]